MYEAEGEYKFDNPDLEYKTKRQKKTQALEQKYKDKPKIAFHKLTEEGDRLFMQAKRDQVFTTVGWSCIGTMAAMGVTSALDQRGDRIKAMRLVKRREFIKIGAFMGTVGLFTLYGFGNARQ